MEFDETFGLVLWFAIIVMGLTIIMGIYSGLKFLHFLSKKKKNKDFSNIIGVRFVVILAIILFFDSFFFEENTITKLLLMGGIIGMIVYGVVMFLRKLFPNKIENDNDDSSKIENDNDDSSKIENDNDDSSIPAIKIVVVIVIIIIAILSIMTL